MRPTIWLSHQRSSILSNNCDGECALHYEVHIRASSLYTHQQSTCVQFDFLSWLLVNLGYPLAPQQPPFLAPLPIFHKTTTEEEFSSNDISSDYESKPESN